MSHPRKSLISSSVPNDINKHTENDFALACNTVCNFIQGRKQRYARISYDDLHFAIHSGYRRRLAAMPWEPLMHLNIEAGLGENP